MKKNFLYTLIASFLTLSLVVFTNPSVRAYVKHATTHVFAEDDEDEHENENEKEDDREEKSKETTTVYEDVVVQSNSTVMPAPTPPVIRYITIVDTGFDKDTDGDGIVDALDPNPTIPEKAFFTDSDGDGVPDASDSFPNEDDFKYIGFTDTNNNGIYDIFENTQ